MRDPQFYASALHRIRDKLDGLEDPYLASEVWTLTEKWKELSFAAGKLKLETWQLLSETIDEWPWYRPSHPTFKEMFDNMMHNDVT